MGSSGGGPVPRSMFCTHMCDSIWLVSSTARSWRVASSAEKIGSPKDIRLGSDTLLPQVAKSLPRMSSSRGGSTSSILFNGATTSRSLEGLMVGS